MRDFDGILRSFAVALGVSCHFPLIAPGLMTMVFA